MQCAIGQFAVWEKGGEEFPLFIRQYAGNSLHRVEVVVINRKDVIFVDLTALKPIGYSAIQNGLIGFEATHSAYGTGIIDGEVFICGLLYVIIMRCEDGTDSGLVPINEITLGPPKVA